MDFLTDAEVAEREAEMERDGLRSRLLRRTQSVLAMSRPE